MFSNCVLIKQSAALTNNSTAVYPMTSGSPAQVPPSSGNHLVILESVRVQYFWFKVLESCRPQYVVLNDFYTSVGKCNLLIHMWKITELHFWWMCGVSYKNRRTSRTEVTSTGQKNQRERWQIIFTELLRSSAQNIEPVWKPESNLIEV
jgi:hypothetical protein